MRVLFVDDDRNLLRSLNRGLMSRAEWDIAFAAGGREALELLNRWEADIVVVDMLMPGMDGAEVLRLVRERHPGIIRLVLSGYSDRAYIMKALCSTHQFLSKPCPEVELLETIERAYRFKSIIPDRSIRDAVTRLDFLPVLPTVLDMLLEELDKEEASPLNIGKIVTSDVCLSANILKLVNSAFFGLKRKVLTPSQAVSYLGLDVFRELVASDSPFEPLDAESLGFMSFEGLLRHSLTTAVFARAIARRDGLDRETTDKCYIAALLHDVGKPALVRCMGDEYRAVLDLAERCNVSIRDAEKRALGITHAQVGGYLLGLWGSETDVVFSVVGHCDPSGAGEHPEILSYVHAANAMEHDLVRINDHYSPHPLDEGFMAAKGLSARLELWRKDCGRILEKGDGRI